MKYGIRKEADLQNELKLTTLGNTMNWGGNYQNFLDRKLIFKHINCHFQDKIPTFDSNQMF